MVLSFVTHVTELSGCSDSYQVLSQVLRRFAKYSSVIIAGDIVIYLGKSQIFIFLPA